MSPSPPSSTLFPYTTLFRSAADGTHTLPVIMGESPARRRFTHDHRSEEHTSELQSRVDLVCRLLLEKKKHTVDDVREPAHQHTLRHEVVHHRLRPVMTESAR